MTLFEKLNKFSEQFEITENVVEIVEYTLESWRETNTNDIDSLLIEANYSKQNGQSTADETTYNLFDKINNELVREEINRYDLNSFIYQWFKDNNLE